jgi:hypothetical protein
MPRTGAEPDALAMPIDITAYERMQSPTALYDGACELLAAAQAMRAAADRPGSSAAIAATLGCIDSTLSELSSAVEAMGRQALRDLTSSASDLNLPAERAAVGDTERAFRDFAHALHRVRHAADSMRERVGPHVARLTLR